MTHNQTQRLLKITILLLGLTISVGLILFALKQNINWFYTPTQVLTEHPMDRTIRVGGMVVQGSVNRQNLDVQFKITDYEEEVQISYHGILPDLFREGQGVVALGRLDEKGHFVAKQVLAKHDENYMPPELKSIKRNIS